MEVAAKAMGTTTMNLESMIAAGISAKEFMPKFAAEMSKQVQKNGALAAATEKVEAAQMRMKNSFIELADTIFKEGGAEGIKGVFNGIASAMAGVGTAFKVIMAGFDALNGIVNGFVGLFTEAETRISVLTILLEGLATLLLGRMAFAMLGIRATSIGAAAGMMTMAGAATALKFALRSLLRIGGLGLLIEGIAWLGGAAIDTFSGGGSGQSVQQNINNDITISGVANDEQAAEVLRDMLASDLSNLPTAVRR